MNQAEVRLKECMKDCREVQRDMSNVQMAMTRCSELPLSFNCTVNALPGFVDRPFEMLTYQAGADVERLHVLSNSKEGYVRGIWGLTTRALCDVLPADKAVGTVVQTLLNDRAYAVNVIRADVCVRRARESHDRSFSILRFFCLPWTLRDRRKAFGKDLKAAREAMVAIDEQTTSYMNDKNWKFLTPSVASPENGISTDSVLRNFERLTDIAQNLGQKKMEKGFDDLWRAVENGLVRVGIRDVNLKNDFMSTIRQTPNWHYVYGINDHTNGPLAIIANRYGLKKDLPSINVRPEIEVEAKRLVGAKYAYEAVL